MPDRASDLDLLARAVTGRQHSVFADALDGVAGDVAAAYTGARVLVTGGAGFIGGQTLRLLLAHRPSKVVVVDTWENGLAELVRDLRSEDAIPQGTVFEPRLADVTSPLTDRLIQEEGPFDVVLAFAAAKHVRTERDVFSALHMLDVNVNGTDRVLRAALEGNAACRLFMVSTDKAADPSSLMGASKRLMEEVVLSRMPGVTTTRFANVAFSSGSLLESWLIRLRHGHVLPVPADTTRFFVRPLEAGQLCLLASVAPAGSIVVPAEGVVEELELADALTRLLDVLELTWEHVDAEHAAEVTAAGAGARVLVTARDTAGEKAAEKFVGAGERRTPWLPGVDRVVAATPADAAGEVSQWIAAAARGEHSPGIDDVFRRVHDAVPEFVHVTSARRLDDRI